MNNFTVLRRPPQFDGELFQKLATFAGKTRARLAVPTVIPIMTPPSVDNAAAANAVRSAAAGSALTTFKSDVAEGLAHLRDSVRELQSVVFQNAPTAGGFMDNLMKKLLLVIPLPGDNQLVVDLRTPLRHATMMGGARICVVRQGVGDMLGLVGDAFKQPDLTSRVPAEDAWKGGVATRDMFVLNDIFTFVTQGSPKVDGACYNAVETALRFPSIGAAISSTVAASVAERKGFSALLAPLTDDFVGKLGSMARGLLSL